MWGRCEKHCVRIDSQHSLSLISSACRWNLLTSFPLLRQLLRSDFWPDTINYKWVGCNKADGRFICYPQIYFCALGSHSTPPTHPHLQVHGLCVHGPRGPPPPHLPHTHPCRFTAYVYPVLVALLLWGPQDREHNFVLSFFWSWWWPLSFVAFILLGRVWCAVRGRWCSVWQGEASSPGRLTDSIYIISHAEKFSAVSTFSHLVCECACPRMISRSVLS